MDPQYRAASSNGAGEKGLYVLATSEEGTRAALKAAATHAKSRGTSVVVLVPTVVPYGSPCDGKRRERAGHAQGPHEDDRVAELRTHYSRLASLSGIRADVRTCACHEIRHIPSRMLLDHAVIVIGGRRTRWGRGEEERLAREWTRDGYQVDFVDVDAGHVRSGL